MSCTTCSKYETADVDYRYGFGPLKRRHPDAFLLLKVGQKRQTKVYKGCGEQRRKRPERAK